MLDNRPAPPSAVKRQLRQEAGFGCCFCGHPFLQYHHIVPWAEDAHFRPEDMMVVCGSCHHLLTVGAIEVVDQRRAKAKPKNVVDDEVRGKLYVNSKELKVHLGGGTATETPCLLQVAGKSLLSARLAPDDGRVLVSASIIDREGKQIARLSDNEWNMLPGAIWDFEVYPRSATIRTGSGEIAFGVDARHDVITMRGKWFYQGFPLEFTPDKAIIMTNTFHGFTGSYNQVHIAVG